MKIVELPGIDRPIELRKKTVKRMSIRITARAVQVSVPRYLPYIVAVQFVGSEKAWIMRTIKAQSKTQLWLPKHARYETDKKAARALVHKKLAQWNQHYHFTWGRIAIRNQSSRWGSCSSKGNLNFNWRILHLPEHLQDYLIVHELCHLEHQNHSRDFWNLVERALPSYKSSRKELKTLTLH